MAKTDSIMVTPCVITFDKDGNQVKHYPKRYLGERREHIETVSVDMQREKELKRWRAIAARNRKNAK
ncbi:hypothetical protein [Escherichia coli]|uniref:hypothetical protein n=1 Tax=Escherichia coli TaxID=562 RepID=UPI001CA7B092|nr:hypothetical protein [Escherichia coli]QZY67686.1 hypothetical protein K7X33_16460 [Escherichia coli]